MAFLRIYYKQENGGYLFADEEFEEDYRAALDDAASYLMDDYSVERDEQNRDGGKAGIFIEDDQGKVGPASPTLAAKAVAASRKALESALKKHLERLERKGKVWKETDGSLTLRVVFPNPLPAPKAMPKKRK